MEQCKRTIRNETSTCNCCTYLKADYISISSELNKVAILILNQARTRQLHMPSFLKLIQFRCLRGSDTLSNQLVHTVIAIWLSWKEACVCFIFDYQFLVCTHMGVCMESKYGDYSFNDW